MPTFKAPYGTADQHVISPAEHLGYRYIVARLVDGGLQADYIRKACEEFRTLGAPEDALYQYDGKWMTRGGLTNRTVAQRLDSYADALTKYEQELKAERST